VKNIRKYLGEKNNLLDDGDELMKDWKDQNNNEFIFTITFFVYEIIILPLEAIFSSPVKLKLCTRLKFVVC
jgi:hypothetical protein